MHRGRRGLGIVTSPSDQPAVPQLGEHVARITIPVARMSAASLTRYHLRFIEQQHAGDPRWSDWEISAPETSPFLGIHAGEEPRCCSAFGIMNPGISTDAKRRMLDDFYVKRDAMMAKLAPTLRAVQGLPPSAP